VKSKVALVANTAWYLQNFRRALIERLQSEGYSVITVAPPDEYVSELLALGAAFHGMPMDSKGANPLTDLRLVLAFRKLFREERPACVLTFTVKPNVYATFAATSLGIPVVSNVSGLGTAFIRRNWVTTVVRVLYRAALRRATTTFFQNPDDLQLFLQAKLVPSAKARLLPGSGVDVDRFSPMPVPLDSRVSFTFLLLGRLLWDKGVGEFVEAARRLRPRHAKTRFLLMGFAETENRTAIPIKTIEGWVNEGLVSYLPPALDVRPALAAADCVVLPSYREGTPRSLLEASSMEIPVITSDAPGCRQVVEDGVTGYLARVRDAGDLAEKMERMLLLATDARTEMGRRGRRKMVDEYDERIVIDAYLEAVRRAASTAG